MIIQDIFRSCSHEHVAEAALLSIGGNLSDRVKLAAEEWGLAPGTLIALSVRRFERVADEDDHNDLQDAISGSELPILTGLAFILEATLASLSFTAQPGTNLPYNPVANRIAI